MRHPADQLRPALRRLAIRVSISRIASLTRSGSRTRCGAGEPATEAVEGTRPCCEARMVAGARPLRPGATASPAPAPRSETTRNALDLDRQGRAGAGASRRETGEWKEGGRACLEEFGDDGFVFSVPVGRPHEWPAASRGCGARGRLAQLQRHQAGRRLDHQPAPASERGREPGGRVQWSQR